MSFLQAAGDATRGEIFGSKEWEVGVIVLSAGTKVYAVYRVINQRTCMHICITHRQARRGQWGRRGRKGTCVICVLLSTIKI